MIKIENLSYKYGNTTAVESLSLNVEPGTIHGMLGPDGAGKTTTMRLITSLIPLQEGDIHVNQSHVSDYQSVRQQIGYMPQRFSLYPDLSVAENLDFFAHIFNVSKEERKEREKQLYQFSNLGDFKERPAGKLSGGMKQKLALMCALIHKPKALILDEPTTGVDPLSRSEFWKNLHDVKKEGIPILVSTPYMDEAAQCDYVSLMDKGKILNSGKPDSLIRDAEFQIMKLVWTKTIPESEKLNRIPGFQSIQLFGKILHLFIKNNTPMDAVLKEVEALGLKPVTEEFHTPEMEDIFIYHMEYIHGE